MKVFNSRLTVPMIIAAALLVVGRAGAQPKETIKELPEVETITLTTSDFMSIRCSYYPGGVVQGSDDKFTRKPGKEVVPVILLHGWEGQRGDYDGLASYLQKFGHAVIVPDLRGHGASTTKRLPNGKEIEVDRERMRPADINAMVLDVEAIKKMLLEENNKGTLNIEMLCIVGAELGGIVAVNYAALDWSRRQLSFQKQGRDVKAIVLLSPEQAFKGATLSKSLLSPFVRQALSFMLVVGQDDKSSLREAKAIHKRLERYHEEPDPKDVRDKKSLFLVEKRNTSLRGTDLVHPRARLTVHNDIATFIQLRLVNKQADLAWKERRNPLDEASE